jgi:DNA-directed RNA polymerase subunit RPC12/RpoP
MGCVNCGGRMLTKVGRKKPMLICSDCGHPLSESIDPKKQLTRVWGSLFMVSLTAIAIMTFFLAQVREKGSNKRTPVERMYRERAILAR